MENKTLVEKVCHLKEQITTSKNLELVSKLNEIVNQINDIYSASNIAYNTKTRQFGIIAWRVEIGYKILDCGIWETAESEVLTKDQAKILINYGHDSDLNWNSPDGKLLDLIFKKKENE